MAKKILIIEDHGATAKLLADVMTGEGLLPVIAADGQRGLEKAYSEKPDLILIDDTLPGTSRLAVCQQLKESILTSNIPVIFISAWGSAEDRRRGFEAGCADYIVKPFELKDLVERINARLSSRDDLEGLSAK